MTQSISTPEARPYRRLPVALSIFAVVLLVTVGATAVRQSVDLGLGELSSPGAGLWPLILSVVLIVFCVAYVAGMFWNTDRFTFEVNSGFRFAVVLGVVCLAVGVLLPFTGYVPILTGLCFTVCWWIGGYSATKALVVSVSAVASASVIFVLGLGIRMPLFPSF